jgi:hypothetical protein
MAFDREWFEQFKPDAWQLAMLKEALERRPRQRPDLVRLPYRFTLEVIDASSNRLWGWLEVPSCQLLDLHVGQVSRFTVTKEELGPITTIIPKAWLDTPPPEMADPRWDALCKPFMREVDVRMAAWANGGAQPRLCYMVESEQQLRLIARVPTFTLYTPTSIYPPGSRAGLPPEDDPMFS